MTLMHIPFLIKRELYFHAFNILIEAFRKYLQAIFIANKTIPLLIINGSKNKL